MNVAIRLFFAGVAAAMVWLESTPGLGIALLALCFWFEGLAGACFGGCEHGDDR